MMYRTALLALATTLGALLSLHAEDRKDAKKSDPARLIGSYTIEKGQRDGKPIPEERIKGSLVTFTDTRVLGTDRDRKEFFAASYTIDTTQRPWTIEMTSTAPKAGQKSAGVVEVEGDTVRVCYALPGGKTPTEFKAGEKQHCFTLKRQQDK